LDPANKQKGAFVSVIYTIQIYVKISRQIDRWTDRPVYRKIYLGQRLVDMESRRVVRGEIRILPMDKRARLCRLYILEKEICLQVHVDR